MSSPRQVTRMRHLQRWRFLCLPGWQAYLGGWLIALAGMGEVAAAEATKIGHQLALEGAAGSRPCADCHGERGQGLHGGHHARLAQQSRFYLRKQLDDFAAGTRRHDIMTPIAGALSATQREAVASYYASLRDTPYPPLPSGDPRLLQQGGTLSAIGAPERGLRACALCHGEGGAGMPPSFPYLAGQYADYLERQLQAWKQGTRRNDPLDVMGSLVRALSDEEIRAVALYFARVRLPAERINDFTAESWP